jgi:hypothetical protein
MTVDAFGNSNLSVQIAQIVQITVQHGLKTVTQSTITQSDLNDKRALFPSTPCKPDVDLVYH